MIDLRLCGVDDLISDLHREGPRAQLVVFDPAWQYDNAPGVAHPERQYRTVPFDSIISQISRSHDIAAAHSRLAIWTTGPWLGPLCTALSSTPWHYMSAGAWTKPRHVGPGYHWRTAAEFVVLYTKGSPLINRSARCLNMTHARPLRHSEKPARWMAQWLQKWTRPGELVVDLYAGLAPLGVACRGTGRRYIGAELDRARWSEARERLALAPSFQTI